MSQWGRWINQTGHIWFDSDSIILIIKPFKYIIILCCLMLSSFHTQRLLCGSVAIQPLTVYRVVLNIFIESVSSALGWKNYEYRLTLRWRHFAQLSWLWFYSQAIQGFSRWWFLTEVEVWITSNVEGIPAQWPFGDCMGRFCIYQEKRHNQPEIELVSVRVQGEMLLVSIQTHCHEAGLSGYLVKLEPALDFQCDESGW